MSGLGSGAKISKIRSVASVYMGMNSDQRAQSQLEDFKYINIMDDSGLEGLKKVKLSYRPAKLASAYIATRPSPS